MKLKHWLYGILVGVLASALISGIMAYENWRLNPSGIFYNEESGTNWAFVWDTFFSWFWPLLPVLVIMSLLVMMLSVWIKRRKNTSSQ